MNTYNYHSSEIKFKGLVVVRAQHVYSGLFTLEENKIA